MKTRDRVLVAIADHILEKRRPPLQKEIVFAVGVCRGNVLRALEQLADEGRIRRFRSYIEITEPGHASIAALRPAVAEMAA